MSKNPYALDANIAKYLFGHQVEYHWIYRVGQEWKHLPCNEPKPVDNAVDRPYLTTGERVPYYMSSQPLLLLQHLATHGFRIELHYAGHGWRLVIHNGDLIRHGSLSVDVFGNTIEDALLDAMTKLVEQVRAQHG